MEFILKKYLYATVENEIIRYEVDTDETISEKEKLLLKAPIQYVAINHKKSCLYCISSNAESGVNGKPGDAHLLNMLKINEKSKKLELLETEVRLPERPIHISLSKSGKYIFIAFNKSGTINSYEVNENGTLKEGSCNDSNIKSGIFTHQVIPYISTKNVLAISRGNDANQTRDEERGALSIFENDEGRLKLKKQIVQRPKEGPRHAAFHHSKPWLYVVFERGNKIGMYEVKNDPTELCVSYKKNTLIDEITDPKLRQKAGAVHIHPNGKFLYVTNRAEETVDINGSLIFAGGENNIAVFELNQETGEPNLIQHIDTHGIEPRTFSIDSSGKLLMVAHQKSRLVMEGEKVIEVPVNLSLFKIKENGTLDYIDKHNMKYDEKRLFWAGFLN